MAKTSDDPRKGLTAFLVERDQPGLGDRPADSDHGAGGARRPLRAALPEPGVPDEDRLMDVGDGLKVTQIRLGTARLTHCMRWLGMAKRALSIAAPYVAERKSFGSTLAEHEGVQWMLGEAAMDIEMGRLLTRKAAWASWIRATSPARRSPWPRSRSRTSCTRRSTPAIQLCGARGYSKDTRLEWMYRYARQARLVDGASEVHKMVLARTFLAEGMDFWR